MRVQATNSAATLEATTDGAGIVSHAGVALLRELADRLELTRALGWNQRGGWRRHPDAAVLRDLAVMLADGWDCLSDLATLGDQPELFGQVVSTPTAWRVVERTACDPDGLARIRAARAHARARAWRAGGSPDPRGGDRHRPGRHPGCARMAPVAVPANRWAPGRAWPEARLIIGNSIEVVLPS